MLKELELENFKCFGHHSVPLRPTTIIVGRNNAGKSTIVEALRLIAISVSRYAHLPVREVPSWLDIPKVCRGVSPSLEHQDFNFSRVFHRYNEPPALIVARSDSGFSISAYLGRQDRIHAVLKDQNRQVVTSNRAAQKFGQIGILPQIEPLQPSETVLVPSYVRGALSSNLASRHFRNQLNLLYEEAFEEFRSLSEETWPGLQIQELKGRGGKPGTDLELMIRNDDFVAEISWMGHGLQMWLQTMWFLARCRGYDTVILDEPDVYMHADLQRRLIRFLSGRFKQVIIATHSIEIMSEVHAEDILIVDRGRRKAQFTTDLPAVQKVIDQIGSIHNLQLARLWDARCCVFVEGDDLSLLKQFQNTLFPDSQSPIDALPNLDIGGWGGWNYVVGSSLFMRNAIGRDMEVYCIFDSDFHAREQMNERLEKAKTVRVNLHIWLRKEIENYLLCPHAIVRIITSQCPERTKPPTVEEVRNVMFAIADEMKDDIMDGFSSEHLAQNRPGGASAANKGARVAMEGWNTWQRRMEIVPGKALLSRISDWSQRKFGVSISSLRLARELQAAEIAPELMRIMAAIENKEPFSD
ncbi:MAG: AAA family ATPase [Acidobacteriia bacterium]|nr:AAA family ATPase [Terriglobia bacterium]